MDKRSLSAAQMSTCKLCLKEKILCKSHSIPNSVFKKLKSNGQAHVIDLKVESKVRKSQDTWVDYLFCKDCELFISSNYEKPCLEVIRRGLERPGVTFLSPFDKYNNVKLSLFILSIFWRASLSKHPAFSNVNFGEAVEKHCRFWIKNGRVPMDIEMSFYIFELRDLSRSLFNRVAIKDMVVNPYTTPAEQSHAKMSCIFEGLYISMVIPGVKGSYLREEGKIRSGSSLIIPVVDIWGVDEMYEVLRQAGEAVNRKV